MNSFCFPRVRLVAAIVLALTLVCLASVLHLQIALGVGYISTSDLALREEMVNNLVAFEKACRRFRDTEREVARFDPDVYLFSSNLQPWQRPPSLERLQELVDKTETKMEETLATRDRLRDRAGWRLDKSLVLNTLWATHYEKWWCNNVYSGVPTAVDIALF